MTEFMTKIFYLIKSKKQHKVLKVQTTKAQSMTPVLVFLKDFIYLFLERGKGGRKRRRETSMCGCPSCDPYWDLACNPGTCPDWELNRQAFASQSSAQSTEPHQPGPVSFL